MLIVVCMSCDESGKRMQVAPAKLVPSSLA